MLHGATWHRGIDLVAIRRVMEPWGPWPPLNEDEQRYACRQLTAAQVSAADIARRLGVSERTVTRWRDEDGGG
ncbi:helix-turn-helix domain-containing protein [Streptomyces sp. BH104]|uniref:helix-turn-helix domain-containing protein n=1 Tax=Streptomyces sp. BH104 TaxID=3410407 RepID=UPI003BB5623F